MSIAAYKCFLDVCVFVYMGAGEYVQDFIDEYVYACVYIGECIYVYVSTRIYKCVSMCLLCVHVDMLVNVYMCV